MKRDLTQSHHYEIKIGDFGNSRSTDREKRSLDQTEETKMESTTQLNETAFSTMEQYGNRMRAPELGSSKHSFKSDVWGLGLIAYKMMTRRDIFEHQNLQFWKIPINNK